MCCTCKSLVKTLSSLLNSVPQRTWPSYVPAGSAYVFSSHRDTYSLFTREFVSCTNWRIQKACHNRTSCVLRGLNHAPAPIQIPKRIFVCKRHSAPTAPALPALNTGTFEPDNEWNEPPQTSQFWIVRCFLWAYQWKWFSMVCITSGSLAIRVKSSAYNICVIEEPVVPVTALWTPFAISPTSLIHREKSKGDKGQPCFTTVFGCTQPSSFLSILLQKQFFSWASCIHVLNSGQKESWHACALQVLPKVLSRDDVILCLFEINEHSVHAARSAWL